MWSLVKLSSKEVLHQLAGMVSHGGITFSEGGDKTYGAVMYLKWETKEGTNVRFVDADAKLTPLEQKREAVKAEICGAVQAARLNKYLKRTEEWK